MTILKNLINPSLKSTMLAGVAAGALTLTAVDLGYAQSGGQGGGSETAGGDGQGGSGAQGGAGEGGSGGGGAQSGGAGQGGAGAGGNAGANAGDGNDDGGDRPSSDSGRPEDKGGRPEGAGSGDEDSDRPDWAGTPGGSAGRGSPPDAGGGGDLYGDLYVILRDAQGVPILNDAGYVQPVSADGSLIPLDEEGHVLDESLVQEVDFGRLNVARAPDDVLDGRGEEVLELLNSAEAISFDPAGRLVITTNGVEHTIDAPLENLSIYIALMETGTIEGVVNPVVNATFLGDGVRTIEDTVAAASFLAAATDKTGEFTIDEIAYINLILDIETSLIEGSEVRYSDLDFSLFTYDRADTYGDTLTTVLVPQDDGSWVPQEINVYETIFGGINDDQDDNTIAAFTQAADDARMVINFIHEYEVPVLPSEL